MSERRHLFIRIRFVPKTSHYKKCLPDEGAGITTGLSATPGHVYTV